VLIFSGVPACQQSGPLDLKKVRKPAFLLTSPIHLLQIQTILSVLELHQIRACALADFTADREFHPALKTSYMIQLSPPV
jgi:hypothetical protein